MNRNMMNFAEAVNDLTWSEMVKISEYIAKSVTHHWKSEEPVDRDSVAVILTDVADDIQKEAELQKASEVTPST